MFAQINVGQHLAFMLHFICLWWGRSGGRGAGGHPWYVMNKHEVSMGVILNRGSFSHEIAVSFPVWSCWSHGGLRLELGLSGETLTWVSACCSTGITRCFKVSLPCSFNCDHLILFILACSQLASAGKSGN